MKRPVLLLSTLAALSLASPSAFSSDRADFINDLKSGFQKTLNGKGDHFPTLGPVEEEFARYYKELDQNPDIENPTVAILGGAYGLPAVEGLLNTKRVTFFLNDLDPRHFEKIKGWVKGTYFEDRLLFAPGSFLNMHENNYVQKFFKGQPIQFNGILHTNIFHHLTAEDGIQGLGYMYDHLPLGGQVFFMAACPPPAEDPSMVVAHQAIVKSLMRYAKLVDAMGVRQATALFQQITGQGAEAIDGLIQHVQKKQQSILYDYNKAHGISFPGYFSITDGALNPFFFKITKTSAGDSQQYFYTKPEELQAWSEIVGFSCQGIRYIHADTPTNSVVESAEGQYYSARLIKNMSSAARDYADNVGYKDLLARARTIDAELKAFGRGKFFEISESAPFIGLTDSKTGKRYPIPVEPTQANQEIMYKRALAQNYKELEEGKLQAYLILGSTFLTCKDYQKAVLYFTLGAFFGVDQCQLWLDGMKAKALPAIYYTIEDMRSLAWLYLKIIDEKGWNKN